MTAETSFMLKSAAIWWVHTQRLLGRYAAASASTSVYSSWSIVHSYLFNNMWTR